MSVVSWSLDDDVSGTTAYVTAKYLTATYTGPVIRRMARHRFLGSPWRSPDGVRLDKALGSASVAWRTDMAPATVGNSFSRCTGVVAAGGGSFALTRDQFTLRTLADILVCRSTHDAQPAALACATIPAFCQPFYHADAQPRAIDVPSGSPSRLLGSLPTTLPADWRLLRIQQPNQKYRHDDDSFPDDYLTPCSGRALRAQPAGFGTARVFDASDNAILTPVANIPTQTTRIPIISASLDIVVGIAASGASAPTVRVRAISDQRAVDLATLDITPSVSSGFIGYYSAHTLTLSPVQRDVSVALSWSVVAGSLGSATVAVEAKIVPILNGYARQMLTGNGFRLLPGASKRTGTLRTV